MRYTCRGSMDSLPDMPRWGLDSCSLRLELRAGRAALTVVRPAIEAIVERSMEAEDMSKRGCVDGLTIKVDDQRGNGVSAMKLLLLM